MHIPPSACLAFAVPTLATALIFLTPSTDSFTESVEKLAAQFPQERLSPLRKYFFGVRSSEYEDFWKLSSGLAGSWERSREAVLLVRLLQVHYHYGHVSRRNAARAVLYAWAQIALSLLSLPEVAIGLVFRHMPRRLSAAAFKCHVETTFRVYDLCLTSNPLLFQLRQGKVL